MSGHEATVLDCAARVEAIETQAAAIQGPTIVVAHSAGVVATVRRAQETGYCWLKQQRCAWPEIS